MGIFDIFKKKDEQPEQGIAENALEVALRKASSEPASRPDFYKKLLSENVVIITDASSLAEGAQTLQENTQVSIVKLTDGRIPVFTSKERIFDKGIIKQQVPYLQMKGEDLFNLAKGASFILNPYSDYGKDLLPAEVEGMLNGTILEEKHEKITITKPTDVLIGQPINYPAQLVNSLKILFEDKQIVKAAYLGWIHDPSSPQPPHLIIAIDMADVDAQTVINEAGFIANQHLAPGEIIDFIRISDGGLSDYL
jgi:hypothetical protein